jgi:hypothetical protein
MIVQRVLHHLFLKSPELAAHFTQHDEGRSLAYFEFGFEILALVLLALVELLYDGNWHFYSYFVAVDSFTDKLNHWD